MIDFNENGLFTKLKKVPNTSFGVMINDFLMDDEKIIASYQSTKDGIVFTTKRLIAINTQGMTGMKKDFTSIPYNKINSFSLSTAGTFDVDSQLEIHISTTEKIKLERTDTTIMKDICKIISTYTLK